MLEKYGFGDGPGAAQVVWLFILACSLPFILNQFFISNIDAHILLPAIWERGSRAYGKIRYYQGAGMRNFNGALFC